jgi:hypothetical protein
LRPGWNLDAAAQAVCARRSARHAVVKASAVPPALMAAELVAHGRVCLPISPFQIYKLKSDATPCSLLEI